MTSIIIWSTTKNNAFELFEFFNQNIYGICHRLGKDNWQFQEKKAGAENYTGKVFRFRSLLKATKKVKKRKNSGVFRFGRINSARANWPIRFEVYLVD